MNRNGRPRGLRAYMAGLALVASLTLALVAAGTAGAHDNNGWKTGSGMIVTDSITPVASTTNAAGETVLTVLYTGRYTGTLSGPGAGTFDITFHADGSTDWVATDIVDATLDECGPIGPLTLRWQLHSTPPPTVTVTAEVFTPRPTRNGATVQMTVRPTQIGGPDPYTITYRCPTGNGHDQNDD